MLNKMLSKVLLRTALALCNPITTNHSNIFLADKVEYRYAVVTY